MEPAQVLGQLLTGGHAGPQAAGPPPTFMHRWQSPTPIQGRLSKPKVEALRVELLAKGMTTMSGQGSLLSCYGGCSLLYPHVISSSRQAWCTRVLGPSVCSPPPASGFRCQCRQCPQMLLCSWLQNPSGLSTSWDFVTGAQSKVVPALVSTLMSQGRGWDGMSVAPVTTGRAACWIPDGSGVWCPHSHPSLGLH
jgi:hypothetical protein